MDHKESKTISLKCQLNKNIYISTVSKTDAPYLFTFFWILKLSNLSSNGSGIRA